MEAHNHPLPSINEITEGQSLFHPHVRIWASSFGDGTWYFFEESDTHTTDSNTNSITWDLYKSGSDHYLYKLGNVGLKEDLVEDVKIAAAIYSFYPNIFKGSKNKTTIVDPKTVKGRVSELRRFLSLITQKSKKDFGVSILTLADISFEMLKRYIPQHEGRSSHLKRALQLIANPIVQKNLVSPPTWGSTDLDSKELHWREVTEHKGIQHLSDSEFLWFLDISKRRIAEFKQAMGLKLRDQSLIDSADPSTLYQLRNVKNATDYYYFTENIDSNQSYWKGNFDIPSISFLTDWLNDVHTTAIWIILTFTGMRESEIQHLKKGCLEEKNGYWFFKSKVVKHQKKNKSTTEGWLAIDISIDAYEILVSLQDYFGADYLISSIKKGMSTGQPYRLGALNTKFKRWIKNNDRDNIFRSTFSVHKCRETLVHHLARNEVGLPFISMQLKHFNRKFNSMPNEVTAGYGNYRKVLLDGINSHRSGAREEVFLELYGENSSFAGGGGEAHKLKIDAFFTGLGLFGKEREKYIKRMAKQNITLMPTSIGTCNHNFVSSSEEKPPCYGDFSCDPECPNHIISPSCGSALKERKNHAERIKVKEIDDHKVDVWDGLIERFDKHIKKLECGSNG